MNIKDDDRVSAVALVVESESESPQPETPQGEELPAASEDGAEGGSV
jgi:hypothetical protein